MLWEVFRGINEVDFGPLRERSDLEVASWSTHYSLHSQINISEVRADYHAGAYECRGVNYAEDATQGGLYYDLKVGPVKPPVIKRHSIYNRSINIELGQNFTLPCGRSVSGVPQPTLIWRRQGREIDLSEPKAIGLVGPDDEERYYDYTLTKSENNFTLTFVATVHKSPHGRQVKTVSFEGSYFCEATNR